MYKGQKMPEHIKLKISQSEKGKYVSKETREKIRQSMIGQTGSRCRNWDGDNVGYCGIHDWLAKEFGKADCCENQWCLGKHNLFHWAKIEGKKYERKRKNFIQLWVRCHNRYDRGYEIKI